MRAAGLKLDLTRGKPAADQLDLSNELDGILHGDYRLADGTDARNYGGLLGIPEARAFGAQMLDTTPERVIAGGNSSLQTDALRRRYRTAGRTLGRGHRVAARRD